MTDRGGLALNAGLGLAALAAALVSLFIGYAALPVETVVGGLLGNGDAPSIIVQEIRLPRAILGLAVGGVLGLSGAVLQGLLRNPLAEPGVTGVSACAALGAVIAMYFGLSMAWPLALPILGIAGALFAALVLVIISGRSGGVLTLILAGVALSSLAAAFTALALNLAPTTYAMSEIVFWLLGSLKDRSLTDVALALPFIGVGVLLLATTGRSLEALTLGEEAAQSLGVDVAALSRRVALGVALAVGASVAVTGSIGFVGLVVPHLLRPFVGHSPAKLIWPSAFAGALLVTLADIAIRLLPLHHELMLGVVTSMIGAPFFLWLILRLQREAA